MARGVITTASVPGKNAVIKVEKKNIVYERGTPESSRTWCTHRGLFKYFYGPRNVPDNVRAVRTATVDKTMGMMNFRQSGEGV